MEATMQNLTINDEEEYIKDGVIYCRKCGQPRSAYYDVLGASMRLACDCQKADEEHERILKKAQELKEKSLLGKRYQGVMFDNTEISSREFGTVYKRMKQYCNVADTVLSRGIGVYLYGDKGRGKTHLTACMVNELTSRLHSVLFTNFSEISQEIRETFGNSDKKESELMSKLANVEFLFIDDFGTEKVAKGNEDMWLQGKIYDIINDRYVNNMPTIFTSNYSLRELVENRGVADKTVDRIMEMTEIIKLEGVSYRKILRQNRELPF